MSGNLTKKQEAFAVKYVECGDASEAYRFAYNAEKMKYQTVNVKACELLKNGKVAVMVSELKEKASEIAEERFTISVEWRLQKLQEIIEAGIANYQDSNGQARRENLSAAKGAIETINSMLGTGGEDEDKGEKLSITFNVAEPVKDIKVTRGE